ncbi:hypothetical protein GCM10009789_43920 [Kribbella sancticallisti]|uniref:Uncharacterized protein n=1 Tax=Kribbella sancticallisti TaxID=460087 RepID=A0ABN2DUM4_9ACTN
MKSTTKYPVPAGGIKATLAGGNTVGAAVREREPRADGYRHLDTPALLRRLLEMSANTYLFGIWDSPTDFDDLREEFLPAAEACGIAVIPYIVPPSETAEPGRASRPFRLDFVGWARAFAELSLQHPNLAGWAIDDFEFPVNAELFTADYMAEIKAAADSVHPGLPFYTCAYFGTAISDRFLDKYGSYIDGIIYPFLDAENENTTVAESLASSLDRVLDKTEPRGLDLIPLIYTGRFLDAPLPPTEEYVTKTLTVADAYHQQGRTLGVIAYGTQLDDAASPATDNRAMYGAGRLALVAPRVEVPDGAIASASQRVRVDPRARRYEVSFWYHRAFLSGGVEQDTYALEVLIDETVVWSKDVEEQRWNLWVQGGALEGPVDVTDPVRGRDHITLTFRLRALRAATASFVDVGVDNIETMGLWVRDPGFEEPDSWSLSSDHGPLLSAMDLYTVDRPARIRAAVGRCFGAK